MKEPATTIPARDADAATKYGNHEQVADGIQHADVVRAGERTVGPEFAPKWER